MAGFNVEMRKVQHRCASYVKTFFMRLKPVIFLTEWRPYLFNIYLHISFLIRFCISGFPARSYSPILKREDTSSSSL
uniref:Uncharacterized protein n=1 Tax=Picea glauca TaxID=3330 RepID=A0A117NI88_PICGL|nr:hypothetical protein ABT39_MTgene2808 [Picea glauca]